MVIWEQRDLNCKRVKGAAENRKIGQGAGATIREHKEKLKGSREQREMKKNQ